MVLDPARAAGIRRLMVPTWRERARWATTAVNALASIVTIGPLIGLVGAALSAVTSDARVIAVGSVLVGAGLFFALARALRRQIVRRAARQSAARPLREALICLVDASRELRARDPSNGAPARQALMVFEPDFRPVDELLASVDFPPGVASYLLWYRMQARDAVARLRARVAMAEDVDWRDEWWTAHERVSVLATWLAADADRRGLDGIAASFSPDPAIRPLPAPPAVRLHLAMNDVSRRGAPPVPMLDAYQRALSARDDLNGGASTVRPVGGPAVGSWLPYFVAALLYPVGIVLTVAAASAVTMADIRPAWLVPATSAATIWWLGVYALRAGLMGGLTSPGPFDDLLSLVIDGDPRRLFSAPLLNGGLALAIALSVASAAGVLGWQQDFVAALTFGAITVSAGSWTVATILADG